MASDLPFLLVEPSNNSLFDPFNAIAIDKSLVACCLLRNSSDTSNIERVLSGDAPCDTECKFPYLGSSRTGLSISRLHCQNTTYGTVFVGVALFTMRAKDDYTSCHTKLEPSDIHQFLERITPRATSRKERALRVSRNITDTRKASHKKAGLKRTK
jgi:hypothetical protein